MQSATIQVLEEIHVRSSVEDAWPLITDPAMVVQCVAGASIVETLDDGSLRGKLQVRLGPTVASFAGTMRPTFDEVAHQGEIVSSGSDGGRTQAQATMVFNLSPAEDGSSRLRISGDVAIKGPLAGFMRTGGTHLVKRMVAEFADNLAVLLERDASAEGGASPAAVAAVRPISASRLVLRTMVDMLASLIRRVFRRRNRSARHRGAGV